MSTPPASPDARDHRLFVTTGVIVVVMLLLLLGLLWVGSRLESIEDRLGFRPPERDEEVHGTPAVVPEHAERHRIYVPVYSHIYARGGKPHLLETTLSIRNVSRAAPVVITRVDYHDTAGALIREHLEQPETLAPLATREFLVEQDDVEGGSGANFVVEWTAESPGVPAPLVEAVMVGMEGQRAFSIARSGVPMSD